MPFVPDDQPQATGHFVPDEPTAAPKRPTARSTEGQATSPSAIDSFGRGIEDVGGAVYNLARGAVMGPLSNVAGIGAIPLHAAGMIDTPPIDVQSKVAGAGAYTPKTAFGRGLEKYNPLALASRGVGKVAEEAGGAVERSPWFAGNPIAASLVGYATKGTIEQLPQLLGARAGASAAERLPARQAALDVARGENLPKDTVRATAKDAGYRLPPEHGIQALASGIVGKTKAEKLVSEHNEQTATRKLGAEVGVPEGGALTSAEFDRLKADTGRDYDAMVEAAGPQIHATPAFKQALDDSVGKIEQKMKFDPETYKGMRPAAALIRSYAKKEVMPTDRALDAIKDLRKQAKSEFRAGKDDLPTARLGVANQLENLFEENLAATGQQGLVDKFRSARERFAKIYLLERVTNDATGRVNMQKLASLSDSPAYKGVLTGEFKTAADFAKAFRKATQRSTGEAPPRLTVFDGLFAIGSLMAGHVGYGAMELAVRLGIPALAERGLLQNAPPSYQVGRFPRSLPFALPAAGAGISNPPTQ